MKKTIWFSLFLFILTGCTNNNLPYSSESEVTSAEEIVHSSESEIISAEEMGHGSDFGTEEYQNEDGFNLIESKNISIGESELEYIHNKKEEIIHYIPTEENEIILITESTERVEEFDNGHLFSIYSLRNGEGIYTLDQVYSKSITNWIEQDESNEANFHKAFVTDQIIEDNILTFQIRGSISIPGVKGEAYTIVESIEIGENLQNNMSDVLFKCIECSVEIVNSSKGVVIVEKGLTNKDAYTVHGTSEEQGISEFSLPDPYDLVYSVDDIEFIDFTNNFYFATDDLNEVEGLKRLDLATGEPLYDGAHDKVFIDRHVSTMYPSEKDDEYLVLGKSYQLMDTELERTSEVPYLELEDSKADAVYMKDEKLHYFFVNESTYQRENSIQLELYELVLN